MAPDPGSLNTVARDPVTEHEIELRVRYAECDPMKVAHHSAFLVWLEIARTELLRRRGTPYRELEKRGIIFVVVELSIRYRKPAVYDDALRICVWTMNDGIRSRTVTLKHGYKVYRDQIHLATASTTLACVNREGRLQSIPLGMLG